MTFVARWSTTSDFISWAIRRRTDFFVSHVELQAVKPYRDCRGVLHPAGSTLGSRWPDGVKWRGPKENSEQRDVFTAVRPGIDEAAAWIDTNRVGWPYDLKGCVGIQFGVEDWHNKKQRFCSEVFSEGFERTGNPILNRFIRLSMVTPRDTLVVDGWKFNQVPTKFAASLFLLQSRTA